MGYTDYRNLAVSSAAPAEVVVSGLESHASGHAVGRLDLWPVGLMSGEAARSLILKSGLDVVVVRYSAADITLAANLQCEELIILQADTLLYFEASTALAQAPAGAALEQLSADDEIEVDRLVGQVFAGYLNHWSADPMFADVDVHRAYRDWARRSLVAPGLAVTRWSTPDCPAAGLCLIDERDRDTSDILLAGVIPGKRRQGQYQSMLRATIARANSQGKSGVAISTQASNVEALRAWCRVGFLPTIALNTLHVIRRERFPLVDS